MTYCRDPAHTDTDAAGFLVSVNVTRDLAQIKAAAHVEAHTKAKA
ncbi:MAG: hypothetical protein ACXVXP_09775 [Mycobacteriaceae bacterium]